MLRGEEILQAAGALFAELGYDNVTTNMIAARAGISPGSLYQFFPNKEAIAQAFAQEVAAHLREVYEAMRSPEMLALPLAGFLAAFIDRIVAVNRRYPGFLALELGSSVSPPLARALGELQQGGQEQLDGLMAAYWPQSTHAQRRLPLLISYRVFLALLPLVIHGDEATAGAVARELTLLLYRYWEPIVGA